MADREELFAFTIDCIVFSLFFFSFSNGIEARLPTAKIVEEMKHPQALPIPSALRPPDSTRQRRTQTIQTQKILDKKKTRAKSSRYAKKNGRKIHSLIEEGRTGGWVGEKGRRMHWKQKSGDSLSALSSNNKGEKSHQQ